MGCVHLAVEENSIEFVIVNRTAEPSLEILMTTPNSLKPSRDTPSSLFSILDEFNDINMRGNFGGNFKF